MRRNVQQNGGAHPPKLLPALLATLLENRCLGDLLLRRHLSVALVVSHAAPASRHINAEPKVTSQRQRDLHQLLPARSRDLVPTRRAASEPIGTCRAAAGQLTAAGGFIRPATAGFTEFVEGRTHSTDRHQNIPVS